MWNLRVLGMLQSSRLPEQGHLWSLRWAVRAPAWFTHARACRTGPQHLQCCLLLVGISIFDAQHVRETTLAKLGRNFEPARRYTAGMAVSLELWRDCAVVLLCEPKGQLSIHD
jgi:hypothetical protein